MGATSLESRVRGLLDGLDTEVTSLETELARLRAVRAVDADRCAERLRAAACAVAEITGLLAQASEESQARLEEWEDRRGFELAVTRLSEHLEGQRFVQLRDRLANLARLLGLTGSTHKVARTRVFHDQLRDEAAAELRARAEEPRPAELPGPWDGAEWLRWAWCLTAPELDALRPAFDKLADFVGTTSAQDWPLPTETAAHAEERADELAADRLGQAAEAVASAPAPVHDVDGKWPPVEAAFRVVEGPVPMAETACLLVEMTYAFLNGDRSESGGVTAAGGVGRAGSGGVGYARGDHRTWAWRSPSIWWSVAKGNQAPTEGSRRARVIAFSRLREKVRDEGVAGARDEGARPAVVQRTRNSKNLDCNHM